MLAIIDHRAGNIRSVVRALDRIGVPNLVAATPADLARASAVIMPGVGAAGSAMRSLNEYGFTAALREWLAAGRPYLGICLGLQLLFEHSTENDTTGLGFLLGSVQRFTPAPDLQVPHIGWNPIDLVAPTASSDEAGLLTGIPSGTPFYFVHSYFAAPSDPELVCATTTHGSQKIPAVIHRDQVWGVQFHPEKSGQVGLRLLANFAQLAGLTCAYLH